jgi:acyl carrier protein
MRSEVDFLTTIKAHNGGDELIKIERAFNIKFKDDAFKDVVSFGDMCDVICETIKHTHAESCTTQQAFYKFRNAFMAVSPCGKAEITPNCRTAKIFPREGRLELIARLEEELGFKMSILGNKPWVNVCFVFLLLGSLAGCIFDLRIGLAGVAVSLIGFSLASKFGKELNVRTVGDLVAKIARENYAKPRHNSAAVNRKEIEQKVKELFIEQPGTQPRLQKREIQFG